MSGFRRWCIEALGWVDARVIGCRWYWLCDRICASDWWGPPDEIVDGVETWHNRLVRPTRDEEDA